MSEFYKATDYAGVMQRTSFREMNCSVAQCLEVVGEWWSMLIVRDLFLGITRFEDFQPAAGHLAQHPQPAARAPDRARRDHPGALLRAPGALRLPADREGQGPVAGPHRHAAVGRPLGGARRARRWSWSTPAAATWRRSSGPARPAASRSPGGTCAPSPGPGTARTPGDRPTERRSARDRCQVPAGPFAAAAQKNPRFGRSFAAASMSSAAVVSVSAASAALACSVGYSGYSSSLRRRRRPPKARSAGPNWARTTSSTA